MLTERLDGRTPDDRGSAGLHAPRSLKPGPEAGVGVFHALNREGVDIL